MDFLTRTVVLFLISCTAISLQNVQNTRTKNSDSVSEESFEISNNITLKEFYV